MAVTVAASRTADRIGRRTVDKFAERRDQLADSALRTLSELGYARTSLREIAQNSEFSHGVLHYYFRDKSELILHCVRKYKQDCVTRYDSLVADSRTADELRTGFGAAMATTLVEDGHLHRLWYDMRSQSLFEDAFRLDVQELDRSLESMIWRVVTRYTELAGRPPALTSRLAYAMFDGLFQQGLLKFFAGVPGAAAELQADVETVLAASIGSVG